MWRRALSAGGGYVGVTALYRALAAPLEVEWSLRDTLVSQRSVTDREWRPDQGNQLLRATADRIEHVDDNLTLDGLRLLWEINRGKPAR